VRLFAIVAEDLLQLSSARLCNQLSRRFTAARVKAQVKEATGANPESALAVNKLIRRETKIKVDAVDLAEPSIGDGARKMCAASMECGEAVAEGSESNAAHRDRTAIRINAEQEAAWPGSFKHRFGVSPTTEVRVNVGAIRAHR
jgi:hypothetical protein